MGNLTLCYMGTSHVNEIAKVNNQQRRRELIIVTFANLAFRPIFPESFVLVPRVVKISEAWQSRRFMHIPDELEAGGWDELSRIRDRPFMGSSPRREYRLLQLAPVGHRNRSPQ